MKKVNDYMRIEEWAKKVFEEQKRTIALYMAEGIDKLTAYHMVADSSTLGAGYRAQLRKDIGLSMFDK